MSMQSKQATAVQMGAVVFGVFFYRSRKPEKTIRAVGATTRSISASRPIFTRYSDYGIYNTSTKGEVSSNAD